MTTLFLAIALVIFHRFIILAALSIPCPLIFVPSVPTALIIIGLSAAVLTLCVPIACVGAAMGCVSESCRVRLEGGAPKVCCMLRQALEADKVGVLVSNLLTLDQEKVLLLHHRFENRLGNCASHSNE